MSDHAPTIDYGDEFDDRARVEMEWKGYLAHCHVVAPDGARYPVEFLTPWRLAQDFESDLRNGAVQLAIPGVIFVQVVTIPALERAVTEAWREGFFDSLRRVHPDAPQSDSSGAASDAELRRAYEKDSITWGDGVVIDERAPAEYRPSRTASVCGFRNEDRRDDPDGLILVEYLGGDSLEVPRRWLHVLLDDRRDEPT